MTSSLARFVDMPVVAEPRGNLAFVEGGRHIPFEIERVYYLYDVPSGSMRAGHAHLALQQLLIPVAGSFDVVLYDGQQRETVTLNRPNRGLLIGPMLWRELENFSSGAVCVVLASLRYDEADYIRNITDFEASVRR